MTDVRPFRALRYDLSRVDLSRVIVPPYDVITPEERVAFFGRDPHNAIRIELPREVGSEGGYDDVAATLAAWTHEGILRHDDSPALYALRQRFAVPDGGVCVREGFFALLHLEDYSRRIVRPHERTLAGPKADRLRMLRATRANLSIVFLLYEDRENSLGGAIASGFDAGPLGVARDDGGVEHALGRIDDRDAQESVRRFLAERPVVIADGHHRYETALAYRDERRSAEPGAGPDAPFEATLAYFANAYGEGTLLLPIHRVVRRGAAPTDAVWRERLAGWSERHVEVSDVEKLPTLLAEHLAPLGRRPCFAADDGSGTLRIFWREASGDELAIRVFHREVVEGVFGLGEAAVREGALDFPKSTARAAHDVRSGRGSVALYLNPLTPEDVFRVTGAGEVLPQKSTFFLPKLPTGLVFRSFEESA
ncbi:hypothetical protein MYXO_02910 [Myxococcaceae bacterium]|jgi:uncharacterized protein (DUF1015 family)|nr:hypothetical protein MYXO_02910 [Myxococcaceae bacterium]